MADDREKRDRLSAIGKAGTTQGLRVPTRAHNWNNEPTRPDAPIPRQNAAKQTQRGLGPPTPGSAPPPSLSPPPAAIPPSVDEQRELALQRLENKELKELNDDLRERVAKLEAKNPGVTLDLPSSDGRPRSVGFSVTNVAGWIMILGALGLGGVATIRQQSSPPEAIANQGILLADTQRDTSAGRKWQLAWEKYERARREVQDCHDRQVGAAFYRLGYRLPALPQGDVHWLSEYKDDPNALRKTPQFRPETDCEDWPSPPTSPSP